MADSVLLMGLNKRRSLDNWSRRQREIAGKLVTDYLYLVSYDLAIEILNEPRSRFGIPARQSSRTLKTIAEVSAAPEKTFADILSLPEENQAWYANIVLWLQRLGKLAASPKELGVWGGFGDHDCDHLLLHSWMAISGWDVGSFRVGGGRDETYEKAAERLFKESARTGGFATLSVEDQTLFLEVLPVLLVSESGRRYSTQSKELLGAAVNSDLDSVAFMDQNQLSLLIYGLGDTSEPVLDAFELAFDSSVFELGLQAYYFPAFAMASALGSKRMAERLIRIFPTETFVVFATLVDPQFAASVSFD